ncbi:WecB/TagA/CpsF family glycosyltransferase [Solirubrobacter sp. CPCC 204708]|uniref:WecB/TagA/CpsF family glycosyltransferase n=1 Tax=Solirubrobacter deserti TaxID=2282478 RepID=A0ABT4RNC9_9ACTN|nr:WecB/TagA/CpsF family glycosyltransferase [Solirubrobacter deserti]MBE2317403.1 WecB/TagA/CpsF family glycosyltransferase [Solirubrobacter deserti]MDA0139985.1 WecB/TagA/CpsF family glycosyltransferase [Solirubrobacter deserti]
MPIADNIALAVPETREAPPRPPTQPLLGVPVALTDYERTLDWIDEAVAARSREYICVAAVHTVMASQEDPQLRQAVLGASFTVPDGQPLVWALKALGHELGDRVYGPTLMDEACARAARTGLKMYLYGGRNQGALAQLTRTLRLRHPGLKIVGGYAPPFRALTQAEEEHVARDINRSGADVVWVGIGVPKQEKWMARMRPRLTAPVLVGVGAAFDFHAGLVPQAPPRMQRLGLEWLFRLMQEPRRLWKRYARYNPLFVLGFARQYVRHRTGR